MQRAEREGWRAGQGGSAQRSVRGQCMLADCVVVLDGCGLCGWTGERVHGWMRGAEEVVYGPGLGSYRGWEVVACL